MEIIKQIKAIYLILIMGVMMMHDALPHFHHQHESVHTTFSATDYHDHGHSHSEDDKSEEKEDNIFFDFLLENHTHSFHTHQHTPSTVESFKLHKVSVLSTFIVPSIYQAPRSIDVEELHRYHLFRQVLYNNPCLLVNPLRGPPSLG